MVNGKPRDFAFQRRHWNDGMRAILCSPPCKQPGNCCSPGIVCELIPRGTLLNTVTVLAGGLLGWGVGSRLPEAYKEIALAGLGLVTVGMGIKMFLASKNVLVVAGAIALGGVLGLAIGIHEAFAHLAGWIKGAFGVHDQGGFVDVMITTSVLYCVGPMTLLGCMQDRLEKRIDLLALKSTMDGIAAVFFGAISGPAMVATAAVVLVFQTALTVAAKPLKPLGDDEEMLADLTGSGGVMLMGTGLGLLAIKALPVANYLPALALAPLFVLLGRKVRRSPVSP